MTMTEDPLAPAGAQFPLARPEAAPPSWDEPSPVGVRPWGLRRMGPVPGGNAVDADGTTWTIRGTREGKVAHVPVTTFATGVMLMPVEACAGRRIAHYRP